MTGHVQRRSRAYTTNEVIEGSELETLVVMPSYFVWCFPHLRRRLSLGRSTTVNVAAGVDEATRLSLASASGSGGGLP